MLRKTISILLLLWGGISYGQTPIDWQTKISGIEEASYDFPCNCPLVNLTIYNGLDGFSGGQQIADGQDEEDIGAVTLANLNDTNGDGIPDFQQLNVVSTSLDNRDELDLMKLEISSSGALAVACPVDVTLNLVSGAVTFWDTPTKQNQITNFVFSVNTLPTTVYIEVVAPSVSVRDIEIEAVYDGLVQDIVKATAIWVNTKIEDSNLDVFKERGIGIGNSVPNGLPDNPVPGSSDMPFLDEPELISFIESAKANDNSRYGAGFHVLPNSGFPDDNLHGGRILMEFEVIPSNLQGLDVFFDIGRRKQIEVASIGNGTVSIQANPELFPSNVELANDDAIQGDEDLQTNNNKIYSFDGPGKMVDAITHDFLINKWHFQEFVRVMLEPLPDNFVGDMNVYGSQASNNFDWHVIDYLKSTGGNFGPHTYTSYSYAPVDNFVSASKPVIYNGTGTGFIAVELIGDCLMPGGTNCTEVYSFDYDINTSLGQKRWRLFDSSGNMIDDDTGSMTTTQWVLEHPNRVRVTIKDNGAVSYTAGTYFFFSVVEFANERNLINTGSTNVFDGVY